MLAEWAKSSNAGRDGKFKGIFKEAIYLVVHFNKHVIVTFQKNYRISYMLAFLSSTEQI